MKTSIRSTAAAAVTALVASVLLAAPATAAEPAPLHLGSFGEVGPASDTQSVQMGSYLLFTASTDAGVELWRTAGSAANTVPVKDINVGGPGSTPRLLTRAGSTAFFVATTAAHGRELWKSNGTAGGTVEVEDLVAGTQGPAIGEIAALGSTIVFTADVAASGGAELWISDGTAAGTTLLKDINPAGDSSPNGLTLHDGEIYFAATDGTHGRELWRTDGTPGGTIQVEDIVAGGAGSSPSNLASAGAALIFSAVGTDGREPFRSQGTAASTYQLRDVFTGAASSSPTRITPTGGATFFSAKDAEHGEELWQTDGTIAGTRLAKDIRPGTLGSFPNELTPSGDSLLFRATDAADDTELWSSTGAPDGTRLVKDVRAGAGGSIPSGITVNDVTGRVLFTADDGGTGAELWLTNGTGDGTARIADLEPGPAGSGPVPVGQLGSGAVFSTSAAGGARLWIMQTDGLEVVLSGTPSLSGSAVVGGMLTADPGVWEAGATLAFAWLRDGAPIPGAMGAAYSPVAADLGHLLSVRVTGGKDGNLPQAKTTSAVGIGAGTLIRRAAPRITGAKKVGRTLKIAKRSYDAGVTKSYQWLRNGKAVKGSAARKSTYRLRSADKGKRIQVRITLRKPGYTTVVKTSAKTPRIAKK